MNFKLDDIVEYTTGLNIQNENYKSQIAALKEAVNSSENIATIKRLISDIERNNIIIMAMQKFYTHLKEKLKNES